MKKLEFIQTDDINYYNKDNLNNNVSSNEEKSNTKPKHIDKLKKDVTTIEIDENEQYYDENERYHIIGTKKETDHFGIDVTHDFSSEQQVESIEESPLVLSIKESIFGPDFFAREYRRIAQEYLQNGGDPDEF